MSVQFGGGSAVIGPREDVLAQLDSAAGYAMVDLDLDQVAAAREKITYLAGSTFMKACLWVRARRVVALRFAGATATELILDSRVPIS